MRIPPLHRHVPLYILGSLLTLVGAIVILIEKQPKLSEDRASHLRNSYALAMASLDLSNAAGPLDLGNFYTYTSFLASLMREENVTDAQLRPVKIVPRAGKMRSAWIEAHFSVKDLSHLSRLIQRVGNGEEGRKWHQLVIFRDTGISGLRVQASLEILAAEVVDL